MSDSTRSGDRHCVTAVLDPAGIAPATVDGARGPAVVSLPRQARSRRDAPQQRLRDTQTPAGPAIRPDATADVALIGLGYVGLPTALAFHAAHRRVLGLDVSPARREAIRNRTVDLLPSDQTRLAAALEDRDGFVVTGDSTLLSRARAVIVAVPTPVDERLLPELTILREACATVVANAVAGQVLILTSTTYVGSTEDLLVAPLAQRGFVVGRDIHVAFSPERIDPGNDRHSHEEVPRVVGGVTSACTRRAVEVLGAYAANLHVVSSPGAAEMTKLFENTFRAVNIALANEIADVSRALDLDVVEIVEAAATKPYGFMPFYPGPGVGGHCIPCDPHYLLWGLRPGRRHAPVIQEAMAAIAGRPHRVVERVREVLSANGRGMVGSRVLVLGVAYKPNVEDVRESPAVDIIRGLRAAGASVLYHDPLVPTLSLRDGVSLASVECPEVEPVDLVLVHTLHAGQEVDWLAGADLVLDATYQLRSMPQRWVL